MSGNIHALALALLVALAGLFGAVGAAAGQSAGNDTLHDQTVDVTNDTRALVVSAENASDILDVTIYGIDDAGISDQVDTAELDATNDGTDSYEYSSLDPDTYPSYRVMVTGPENATAETISVEKVQVIGGGGGGGLIGGGGSLSIGLVLALAIGGLVWYGRQA